MTFVLGLLGGVASGKSSVARAFEARGFLRLDADELARKLTDLPEIRSALATRFGAVVLDEQGGLDREALARVAFADAEATADLNAIVHPAVRLSLVQALDRAANRPVVLDVPLLLESPLAARVSRWLFIEMPEELREARAATRGWAPGERARREARQLPLATKRARAHAVLENCGTIQQIGQRVEDLLSEWGLPDLPRDRVPSEP